MSDPRDTPDNWQYNEECKIKGVLSGVQCYLVKGHEGICHFGKKESLELSRLMEKLEAYDKQNKVVREIKI